MNRRRVFNKLGKIFMVMTMILSMCFSAVNTKVNAWDGNVPHEFTRVKNIKYPEWWGRKIASLKQWSTYSCTYNGQWSYCLESSKKTPSAGNYTASVIENNSMVRKLLYYGYGGPAAWDVFGPDHDLKTAVCPNDSYLTNDDVKYLLTHIFLSGAYSGDWNGFSEELFNQTFGGSYGTNLMNIYRGIEQLPDPSNGANFSTGNTAKFTATYDKANSLQKTNTVKFNASSSESVQLPLQNNVTIHIAGTSNTKTGGTATVYGGQSFYLTTPATNPLSNYQSGNLTSSAKGKFCALSISDGNSASQTHGSWYQETTDTLKYSVEWMGFGYIDLKKTSANPDMTNNSSLYSLKGAKYGIYEGNKLVQELTTDVNGYAKSSLLLEGKYTVKEISASKGYDVDQTSHGVTVTRGQTTTTNVTEKPKNDPIGLEIVKNDAENKGMPQGDATLEGAEFTVKYYDGYYTKDNLPSKATRTWVLKTKKLSNGKYVAGLLKQYLVEGSDELYEQDGTYVLPLGTISIEETKAPKGYFLKGAKLNVTDTASGTTSSVIDGKYVAQINEQYHGAKLQFGNDANQMIVQEKVKKQRIQLFKSGEREGISGVVKGLQGAEFTWKLKTEVDNVGWDNAKTYAVITTNENGRAITDYLPYGKYLVRETKTPKDYMTAPDFTVSVTKDSSEYNELEQVKLVSVNNKPFASYVKLVKVDEDTGKKVTLNSASFKIKDAQGNYVVQKVSGTKVDTFTTNSDNEIIPVVEKGTVTLPLMLNAGTYTIEEIKTPKGFLDLEKPVEFVISSTYDYDVDEDADPIVEVKIRNRQPKGEIKLNKTVMDLDTDTDLVDRSDLSKIQFVLKAKEDIYSSIDGSLMFEKDSVITTENSGAIVNTGSEVGNGIYALSLDGHLDISNLPMSTKGASYYLQEVKTLDGCVLDTAQYDAVFKQSDFTTKNYIKSFDVENKTTDFEFNKTDVTGDKEVEGAQLTITDEDGNVVDQWTSTEKVHSIEGLVVGKTYTLSETVTAKDYVKATDIKFTVKNSSELETVTMKDKQVFVSKTTVGGEEVTGAHMQIIDEDGNIIDEWYSEGKSHIANGLEEGKIYTLHEDLSPLGFNLANDFTFEVTKEKENQTVEMIDTVTEVNKTDVDGKAVKEATLSIVSEKTKDIVDQWVAGQHILDIDKDIKSQLEENGKAEGTYMDEEDSMVMFSIAKNKDRDDYTFMQVKDGITTYSNIDLDGNETTHRVQGLVAGEKYILRETKTPEEYVQAKEIEFTAGEDEDQTLVMQDKQVTISKTTVSGDEITGALMQIKDEDGNIIDEWTSEGKVHYATGLVEGKKYILHEDLAPTGLNLANDIEFEISYAKENQKVEMIDTINEVSKVDEKGNLLKGAEMTVTSNKTKNIIDKWISGQHIFDVTDEMKSQLKETGKVEGMYVDDEDSTVQYSIVKNKGKDDYTVMFVKDGVTTYTNIDLDGNETRHMIQGLEAGEEYVLKETKTPNGYATFKTQTFTAEEGKDTSLSMVDEDTKVEVSKQDITTKKELEGAKLKVTDKDGKVIDEWTSGKQLHMIKNLTAGETYTLTEAIAPKNYKVAESLRFTVKDTGKIQRVIMYDRPVNNYVETGDENNYYFILMLICMIFIWHLLKSYLNNFID
ncbi:SpaA isopeptide-forming pilin-related protein [Faecalibacillus faecis]|uniref:SpaA isopeptide-forming pilin-related protein n=1 Tax=Faecalibacillus faecis TaxID=1982628 RepID=UPI000E51C969|nr:SpaA isopeptide-forming pilin-related protein [Faecalibacillus faecis]RHB02967.1 hypothetical protein DW906_07980 [Coprobacillus sp. AM42-12AC]